MEFHVPLAVHPGVALGAKMKKALPEKTGRDLDGWRTFLGAAPPAEWTSRLKDGGCGTNYANSIIDLLLNHNPEQYEADAYLQVAPAYAEALVTGKKAGLRPIFDAVLRMAQRLGNDIKVCPCKTYLPLYRKNCFAHIQPSTQKRVDLGLALKGYSDLPARLLAKQGAGDRISHRIALEAGKDVDSFVQEWLTKAYQNSA